MRFSDCKMILPNNNSTFVCVICCFIAQFGWKKEENKYTIIIKLAAVIHCLATSTHGPVARELQLHNWLRAHTAHLYAIEFRWSERAINKIHINCRTHQNIINETITLLLIKNRNPLKRTRTFVKFKARFPREKNGDIFWPVSWNRINGTIYPVCNVYLLKIYKWCHLERAKKSSSFCTFFAAKWSTMIWLHHFG